MNGNPPGSGSRNKKKRLQTKAPDIAFASFSSFVTFYLRVGPEKQQQQQQKQQRARRTGSRGTMKVWRSVVTLLLVGTSSFVLAEHQAAEGVGHEHPAGRADALEEACKDKKAGDDCTAVTAGNRTVEGECFSGAPEGEVHGPPLHCRLSHPGEVACKHLEEKSTCKFNRPGDNRETTGVCSKTPHGSMMCRENDMGGMRGGDEGPDHDGLLPPHLACKNLTAGDSCKTHGPTNEGICRLLPGTTDQVHCRSIMPAEKACMGKEKDSECVVERPGHPGHGKDDESNDNDNDDTKEKGVCQAMGRHDEDLMVCRPADIGRGPGGHAARLSSLSPEAQKELQDNQVRLREIREIRNFRNDKDLLEEYTALKEAVRKARSSSSKVEAEAVDLLAGRRLRGSAADAE